MYFFLILSWDWLCCLLVRPASWKPLTSFLCFHLFRIVVFFQLPFSARTSFFSSSLTILQEDENHPVLSKRRARCNDEEWNQSTVMNINSWNSAIAVIVPNWRQVLETAEDKVKARSDFSLMVGRPDASYPLLARKEWCKVVPIEKVRCTWPDMTCPLSLSECDSANAEYQADGDVVHSAQNAPPCGRTLLFVGMEHLHQDPRFIWRCLLLISIEYLRCLASACSQVFSYSPWRLPSRWLSGRVAYLARLRKWLPTMIIHCQHDIYFRDALVSDFTECPGSCPIGHSCQQQVRWTFSLYLDRYEPTTSELIFRLVLWFTNFLQTIPMEIEAVWSRKMTMTSLMFLLNRHAFALFLLVSIVSTLVPSYMSAQRSIASHKC